MFTSPPKLDDCQVSRKHPCFCDALVNLGTWRVNLWSLRPLRHWHWDTYYARELGIMKSWQLYFLAFGFVGFESITNIKQSCRKDPTTQVFMEFPTCPANALRDRCLWLEKHVVIRSLLSTSKPCESANSFGRSTLLSGLYQITPALWMMVNRVGNPLESVLE